MVSVNASHELQQGGQKSFSRRAAARARMLIVIIPSPILCPPFPLKFPLRRFRALLAAVFLAAAPRDEIRQHCAFWVAAVPEKVRPSHQFEQEQFASSWWLPTEQKVSSI